MRKLLLTLLLATAVSPALADPGDDHRFDRRAERGQRADRPERADRAERGPPRVEAPRAMEQRPVEVQRPRGGGWSGAPQARQQGQWHQGDPRSDNIMQRYRDRMGQAAPAATPQAQPPQQQQQGGRGWLGHAMNGGQPRPTLPVGTNGAPRQWDGHRDPRGDWRNNDGRDHDWRDQAGRRDDRDHGRWSNDWHRDPRYDWQRYRRQNRFVFQLGAFNDPFGYGYRPLGIGYTLYSGYYQPNYWLQDPWQYRLPPAYGRYRWVRYYDDALLVDIYTGRIVDSIRDFFW